MEAEILAVEDLVIAGNQKIWFKVSMEEAPIVFENWFETPPLPIRKHVPLYPNVNEESEPKEVYDELPVK